MDHHEEPSTSHQHQHPANNAQNEERRRLHKEKQRDLNEPMDLDDLLPQLDEFGKYQKILIWFICLPACIPCGFCAFNQLFMAEVPEHWCRVPALELPGVSQHVRREVGVPKDDSCLRYAVNFTSLLESQSLMDIVPNSSWPVESCVEGWEYDLSDISSSIVMDFELVCDHAIYPTLGLAALNAGGPIGVYGFGVLNDGIGRKKSFFLCLAVLIVGGLITAFSSSFWMWAGSRFIVGLTIPAIYQIPFIIALELVGANYRSFVTVLTCIFYTLGLVLLAGVTYFIRDWKAMAFVTSAPFLFYFFYWRCLPESPRWLLAKGRLEEASLILEKLAATNGKELPDSFKQKLKQHMMLQRTRSEERKAEKGPGVTALCKTPNMRLKTTLITLNWFANEMVYVGLSYYGPALGNDRYLSFLLSSLVEIPSYLCCWAVMDRWGRRWPLSICMVLSGISCIITVLLPADAVVLTLILYLFAKFTISASFLIIYPFAGELYPTQLRGVGIGASAYISGLGLIVIPFIVYLGMEMLVLPLVVMGVISVIGGLAGLRLPETLHTKLPQTVEEGEEFGKDFSMNDCLRCVPASQHGSYEDLSVQLSELNIASVEAVNADEPLSPTEATEETPFGSRSKSIRRSIARQSKILVRQSSVLETPYDSSGAMKMTYWY
ncbi:carcinine transporter [Neocloeon triangulifer]|uniref:carcinine transporter n=1 Tax=Neocloeon triangulifer TaxID=2078957 RepID=UPI00286ED691|nr:carcinine transporter [Neocloeon triangulifer]